MANSRASSGIPGAGRAERKAAKGGNGQRGEEALARGMGWFSLALGATELVAPRAFARLIGAPETPSLTRVLGLREIASGVGILSEKRPVGWMWSRVAGDVMDLAYLGAAFGARNARAGRLALATAAVAGATAIDGLCSLRLMRAAERENGAAPGHVRTTHAIAINRTPEQIYAFWRELGNLPRFMRHLESVESRGENRSHWVACGPMGKRIEWDAEITEDRPNRRIAWKSLEGADVDHRGSVTFENGPGGRGSMVRVELEYRPPAGIAAATIASLFGEAPEQKIRQDLRRLKQLRETGEIPTTEGQPSARTRAAAAVTTRERGR
jgi:uncharacterized membrane protein